MVTIRAEPAPILWKSTRPSSAKGVGWVWRFAMGANVVEKWRKIARDTAWKDYAGKTPLSAELLKLADGVQVS